MSLNEPSNLICLSLSITYVKPGLHFSFQQIPSPFPDMQTKGNQTSFESGKHLPDAYKLQSWLRRYIAKFQNYQNDELIH